MRCMGAEDSNGAGGSKPYSFGGMLRERAVGCVRLGMSCISGNTGSKAEDLYESGKSAGIPGSPVLPPSRETDLASDARRETREEARVRGER